MGLRQAQRIRELKRELQAHREQVQDALESLERTMHKQAAAYTSLRGWLYKNAVRHQTNEEASEEDADQEDDTVLGRLRAQAAS